jgi:hypothetical protein
MEKPMHMLPFKVSVTRYYKDNSSMEHYNGIFISKVYAINNDSFLVYDPGDYNCPAGFVWVDFNEVMTSLNNKEEVEPVVTLYEEE